MRDKRTLLVRVWCGQAPRFEPVRPEGDRWLLGRDTLEGDSRMSRRHIEVRLGGGRWSLMDLGSANGSFLDARPVSGTVRCAEWQVLQVGRSLFVPLRVAVGAALRMRHTGDDIVGPSLHAAIAAARDAVAQGRVVVFAGPVGCGVVAPARELHRVLADEGEFAAIDARDGDAALPERGTVLVHGCPDLACACESPLVERVLREPALRLCLGVTSADLEEVRLPASLAARATVVRLPELERRPEEIPWWVRHAVRSGPPELAQRGLDVTLAEACLLRPWARGLLDLVFEVQAAAAEAQRRRSPQVMGRHLSELAGLPLDEGITDDDRREPPRGRREPPSHLRQRDHVAAVLQTHAGDRAAAARTLGVSPEALEQWIRRHRLEQTV